VKEKIKGKKKNNTSIYMKLDNNILISLKKSRSNKFNNIKKNNNNQSRSHMPLNK
jgi:hypothetical protein